MIYLIRIKYLNGVKLIEKQRKNELNKRLYKCTEICILEDKK